MRETLMMVSRRGQITLPAELRKRLGIEPGGLVVVEERSGELVLRPATVVELETYSDEDIARWDQGAFRSRSDLSGTSAWKGQANLGGCHTSSSQLSAYW
jgi:antitoxin PrlF